MGTFLAKLSGIGVLFGLDAKMLRQFVDNFKMNFDEFTAFGSDRLITYCSLSFQYCHGNNVDYSDTFLLT